MGLLGAAARVKVIGQRPTDLVQENLAAVGSEVLQSCQRFAQYLQQTALNSQQSLLLSFLSSRLPSARWLFRGGVGGLLCPRQWSRG